jgi:taurine---2-oxoglutarate transaminase
METEGIVENAARVGVEAIGPGLARLAEKHRSIGEVRGEGVFWAVELVADRDTREPLPAATMGALKAGLLERGLLPFVQDNRVHVVPPCIVTDAEVVEAMAIYDDALSAVEA